MPADGMTVPDASVEARPGDLRRRLAVVLTFVVLLLGVSWSQTIDEAGAADVQSCLAEHQTRAVSWQPDEHRVRAMCKQLSASLEARGFVNMSGCCDKETSWFRDTWVWHYSAWAQGSYSNVGWQTRTR